MRFHFIVNPVAGRGRALPVLDAVVSALEKRGIETTRHVTSGAGDAADHVAGLSAGSFDRLVVVGGDGTLREVVNGRPLPMPWPIGIVPMGTANLVGRELRMPRNRNAAHIALRLAEADAWGVDVMRMRASGRSEEIAVSAVGVGFDAEIVNAVTALRAQAAGAGGYVRWIKPIWDVVRGFSFPPLRVTVDGRKTYAASACMVLNAHSYGGLFVMSPTAALDSGQLDVCLIRARTNRDLLRIVCGAGLRRAHLHHDVKLVRGHTVRIRAPDPVPVQADGDPAGATELRVELVPRAATLLRA